MKLPAVFRVPLLSVTVSAPSKIIVMQVPAAIPVAETAVIVVVPVT